MNTADPQPSERPPDPRPQGRSVMQILIVVAIVGLVVGPVGLAEFPREIARWYQATAANLELDGQLNQAIKRLDQAIAWDNTSVDLLIARADLKRQVGQWASGLDDCKRARQLAPDSVQAAELRSQLLLHLGRYREAIAQCKSLLDPEGSASTRAEQLNGLAYARALGGLELEKALNNADEAIQLSGNQVAMLDPAALLYAGRAFSLRQLEKYQAALKNLNEAVQRAESTYDKCRKQAQSSRQDRSTLKAHLAGVLFQRAELLDTLDRAEDAKRDRTRIDQLGKEGSLSMILPTSLSDTNRAVFGTAGILDTRGFVYYQLKDYQPALRDLNRATNLAEWALRSFQWEVDLLKHQVVDMRPLDLVRKRMERNVAVISYHRMLAAEASGQLQQAAKDRQRVHQLGYEPNKNLF